MKEKKNIILFNPRTFHNRNYRYFHIPYSLLSISTLVDPTKFSLFIWDNNQMNEDNFKSRLEFMKDSLLCVGISAMIGHQIADGLTFAKQIKELNPTIPIVWGGPLATVLPELIIKNQYVDIVVKGQGQQTLPELLECLWAGKTFELVSGILFKYEKEIIHTQPRAYSNINNFPSYDSFYSLLEVEQYIRNDEHIGSRTVSYHSSQGCPFNCGFCSEVAIWNHKWSGFSTEKVFGDINWLVENFSINGIKFYDAEFFVDKKRLFSIIEKFISHKLQLKWGAAVHPLNLHHLSDQELIKLRKSGASRLLIGAESGIQKELLLIGKKTNREILKSIAKRCADKDISASFTFVTGYPGMPEENIGHTLDFASELIKYSDRHEAKVHFFAPYPETPLYNLALKYGFIPPISLKEWAVYDYYDIVTPWIDPKWEKIVRSFNEGFYPYIHKNDDNINKPKEKVCQLLRL